VLKRHAVPLVVLMVGVLLGLGFYTFHYAHGLSYLSKDPRACINCHIMNPQFDAWQKSSHHTAASCIECHLPHDFIPKYIAKADNGYRHSKGFTFQDFREPIMITARNSRILNDNCLRCHADVVHGIAPAMETKRTHVSCVHCHRTVGHGEPTGMGRFDPHEGQQP
jgi:cytochrome c nitrite reductase small subunit